MSLWMCGVTNDMTRDDQSDNKSGGNVEERSGKEVEMVWACCEKRDGLRSKESDGNIIEVQ